MGHSVPGKRTQTLIAVIVASIPLSPLMGAERVAPIPDFSGYWGRDSLHLELPLSGPGPVVNMMHTAAGIMDMSMLMGDYTNPIVKPEAAAILKQRGEQSLAGKSVPNAHEQCRPEPPPFIFAVQFAMKMIQQKDEVVILYSHDNKVRHVRLNQPHPARLTPTGQGDSVGHYEGDTLVIDTVGIKATPISTLDWYGTPHSDALHVVERYRLIDQAEAKEAALRHDKQYRVAPRPNPNGVVIDPNYKGKGLQIELTVEDTGMFTMPWTALVTYQRALGDLGEMRCAESFREYYNTEDTPIPQADKPDF
jgi:hypothetical protein